MRRNNYKYGDYVELEDGRSVLDGHFSATVLREIADDMDKLALRTPRSITTYPPVAFVQIANDPEISQSTRDLFKKLTTNPRRCQGCKKGIARQADSFTDADGKHWCGSCAMKAMKAQ
jgi:hypothetical protein